MDSERNEAGIEPEVMHRRCWVLLATVVAVCGVPAAAPAQVPLISIVKAGVARADITPPPGYATGGHGPAGTTSRGYWMPLTATAFYFEDSEQRGAALVSMDLFAVPSIFHQQVAQTFAARGAQNTLALERVVIAATHTHQGTANFFSVAAHNRRGSNVDGFDSRLRAFLLERIVAAIDGAVADAHQNLAFDVDIMTGTLSKNLFRNRSPEVFVQNGNATTMLDEMGMGIQPDGEGCKRKRQVGEPRKDWGLEGCPRLRAVDRSVSLLRLRRDGKTAAMAVFAAIHPTGLPSTTPLFSQDVFGAAREALENSGSSISQVAFFNGAEGDITLRRTTRDARDIIRLGGILGEELRHIHDTVTPRSIKSGPIAGRLHFAKPGEAAPSAGTPVGRLANTAMGGSEAIRGGEDDPGPFLGRLFAFFTPRTGRRRPEHGVKVPAILGVESWTDGEFPQNEFPTRLPLSLVTLGDVVLAVVPFEMNTSVGYAIRKTLGLERGRLEIVGLANEYASYTSSADEYQKQDYMGAFTLWGPEQAAFVIERLRELHSAPPGFSGKPPADMPGDQRVALGPHRLDDDRGEIFKGLDNLLDGERPPAFCWDEPTPPDLPRSASRTVEIWPESGGAANRSHLAVVMLGRPKGGTARWAAIWLAPVLSQVPVGRYRFKVTPDGRPTITSAPFDGATRTKDCSTIAVERF